MIEKNQKNLEIGFLDARSGSQTLRHEKIALAVFAVSFLAVIILLLTFAFSGITGKVVEDTSSVGTGELNTASEEISCSDLECEFGCEDGVCVSLVTEYTYRGRGDDTRPGIVTLETTPLYEPPVQTHELGNIDIEEIIDVLKDEKTFFSVSGNEYYMILKESTPIQAVFEVSGVSQPVTITVAETKGIDLTGDGNSDISVKIRSINIISNKVKLSIT